MSRISYDLNKKKSISAPEIERHISAVHKPLHPSTQDTLPRSYPRDLTVTQHHFDLCYHVYLTAHRLRARPPVQHAQNQYTTPLKRTFLRYYSHYRALPGPLFVPVSLQERPMHLATQKSANDTMKTAYWHWRPRHCS